MTTDTPAEIAREAIENVHRLAEEHLRAALQIRTWLVTLELPTMVEDAEPGQIIRCGAGGALWRVLARTRLGVHGVEGECTCSDQKHRDPPPLAGHYDGCPAGIPCLVATNGYLLDLQPVDPHEVPATARWIREVPFATKEIGPELAKQWRGDLAMPVGTPA